MILLDQSEYEPKIRRLEERLKNLTISGTPNVLVAGHFEEGYSVDVRKKKGKEAIGACCIGTDCSITTQSICVGLGGTYQGDATDCDPNPCGATGACCFDDGTCSVETEAQCSDDSGTYQGDGTVCDPNPCPQPTGACCVGSDCSIETEDDCIGMGGTYQGDDTSCDPNPCTSCCDVGHAFQAFDGSGRLFLKQTMVTSGTSSNSPPPGCFNDATNTWTATSITTIDPTTCASSCTCEGSGNCDVAWDGACTPCTSTLTAFGCDGTANPCGSNPSVLIDSTYPCTWNVSPHCNDGVCFSCFSYDYSEIVMSATTLERHYDRDISADQFVHATSTVTLEDECLP